MKLENMFDPSPLLQSHLHINAKVVLQVNCHVSLSLLCDQSKVIKLEKFDIAETGEQ